MQGTLLRALLLIALAFASPAGATEGELEASASGFCEGLKQVAALALSRERFASITGQSKEGDFHGTTLPLVGWHDCSIYGRNTYTCDSRNLGSAEQAERLQAQALELIRTCPGGAWKEVADRSSPSYVILQNTVGPVSLTLSTDLTDDDKHVIHLILFIRR